MPTACTSVRVIGAVSIMSSAFPAGGPSKMSVNTTSASSMSAIRCAVVEPTNPPPTTVTFFRLILFCPLLCELCVSVAKSLFLLRGRHALHVLNNRAGERRRAQLGRARHQSFQVVRNFFLLDGARDSVFNQLRDRKSVV